MAVAEEKKEEKWPPVEIAHLKVRSILLVVGPRENGEPDLVELKDVYVQDLPQVGNLYMFNPDRTVTVIPRSRLWSMVYEAPEFVRDMLAGVALDRTQFHFGIAEREVMLRRNMLDQTHKDVR